MYVPSRSAQLAFTKFVWFYEVVELPVAMGYRKKTPGKNPGKPWKTLRFTLNYKENKDFPGFFPGVSFYEWWNGCKWVHWRFLVFYGRLVER